ncbi:hypothetical protein CVT24_009167 [Panaeolus cyanescens]|uniref:Methyltransferase domain-containing protein n=1 Tax=Panaeolus cyanescens TaxID=181874 RepID=A0A409Y8K2_9AGAR|nr:hypothetical protein CVT24_009167 [Panaeolus cyanescens]
MHQTDMDYDSDQDSDIRSTTDFSGMSVSSKPTTVIDGSMRSASPAPSVLSFTSSFREHLFKEEYGRNLNAYSDVYKLPADEEELTRLDEQHNMLISVMGGKYVAPMYEVMVDDTPGEPKAVLDLGSGSGTWIMDVVRDWPNCTAVAVDLIPLQIPSEVDDINLGLEHFYGDFNVVHSRLISYGIKDYHRLVDQISHVLRPRGLVFFMELDFHAYDEHDRKIEAASEFDYQPPWWSCWFRLLRFAIQNNGGDVDAAPNIIKWVQDHPAFEEVVYKDFFLPIIPRPRNPERETPAQAQFYQKVFNDLMAFHKSCRPLLLGSGIPEDMLDDLDRRCLQESAEGRIPQFTHIECVWARKKANVDEEHTK